MAEPIDRYQYWTEPPPSPSAGLKKWLAKIEAGWRPNRRIGGMGYDEASQFYGVYIWEYLNIIQPLLWAHRKGAEPSKE